jgi:hypothetical protein
MGPGVMALPSLFTKGRHMDARFSALPYSAQAAVRDASKRLAAAQRFLASKQKIADRAERAGEAAKKRAARLQDTMSEVKPPPLRLRAKPQVPAVRPDGGRPKPR